MEKCDVSKNKLLNDFLYAVCMKLGLDMDGDYLNSSVGTFVVNAKCGYIVKEEKKDQRHILSPSNLIMSLNYQRKGG